MKKTPSHQVQSGSKFNYKVAQLENYKMVQRNYKVVEKLQMTQNNYKVA